MQFHPRDKAVAQSSMPTARRDQDTKKRPIPEHASKLDFLFAFREAFFAL